MRDLIYLKALLISFIVSTFLISGLYFFLPFNSQVRQNIGKALDMDVLYLTSGETVHGWIWDEKEGMVVGGTKEGKIFTHRRSECVYIHRNVFLQYLRQMI
ncbi:MAG: hypothetical protein JSW40_09655 [Candidatus Omnitrophota bacterium]|nr:MAG: hypothetical protein JSW40_09655 [Candidatus Omnitrophota bacterium]